MSYLVILGKEAVVIDPGRHLSNYLKLLEGVKLVGVIDTHAHADHLSGGRILAERFSVPYYLHPYDAIHPKDLLPITFPFEYLGKATPLHLTWIPVPGHTLGNSALLLNNRFLFSGDSLFIDSIARPDLGDRTKEWSTLHYHSLRKLWEFPDSIIVLPGHAQKAPYQKTLVEIKKINKGFIQSQGSLEEFQSYILKNLPELSDEYPEIKRANLGILDLDEEQAIRLEHGKNLCAIK